MKATLAAFFLVKALTSDGDRWTEEGPWSSHQDCRDAYTGPARQSGQISECYYREGNTVQGNYHPEETYQ